MKASHTRRWLRKHAISPRCIGTKQARSARPASNIAELQEPLPDLVINGRYLLGCDWRETAKARAQARFKRPPVMIMLANRTETAARIKYAFDHKKVYIDELADPARTLHIDSKVLEEVEAAEEPIADISARKVRTRKARTGGRRGS